MTQILEQLSAEIGELLKANNQILATAESCTAGGLSHWVTYTPGSSDWFDRAAVTYSNQAKMEMLGVNSNTLDKLGAVSEETAREMADGLLTRSQATITLSITGIAGPDGGTADKPVGTVWFATALKNQATLAEKQIFTGDRQTIRIKTIEHAFHLIKSRIA